MLVWDGEGAVGRWRQRQPELTAHCHAFRGTLAAKVLICKPGDPEAKGLVETWMSSPTQQRGGRAKRMVKVTRNGARAAREFYEAVIRISRGTAWGEGRLNRLSEDAV